MCPGSWWLMARCLIGLALLPVPLAAQMHVPIGFIAGVTRADFHGKDVTGGKGVTGLVFGGLVHLELPGPLALEPQLLYIHKGGRLSGEGATATFEIGYLQCRCCSAVSTHWLPPPGFRSRSSRAQQQALPPGAL